MDRLDAMTLFLAAVDEKSLAAAARRTGRSPASVTRAVTLLERLAGEQLLLRSTRSLRLTSAGEHHVEVWREVLGRLDDLEIDQEGDLKGRLVITAPELFGRLHVLPVLETFLSRHPGVSARLLLLNRLVDLVGEGVDVAVRLAPLPDSSLVAIRLGSVQTLVCASPDYVARKGVPTSPADLGDHDCIGLNAAGPAELWSFGFGGGAQTRLRSVRAPTRLSLNSAEAALGAALRGQGLVRVRAYQVVDHLTAGRLVRLLDSFEPPAEPASLVFHPDRGRQRVVRAFLDHAKPLLQGELARIENGL